MNLDEFKKYINEKFNNIKNRSNFFINHIGSRIYSL
jgi:hypothetical protein